MFCHIRFKACRKCGGDLSLEQDRYGTYFQCIQCGAVWNETDTRLPYAPAPKSNSTFSQTPVLLK
ncbi:MAG: hypothetical protein PHR43_06895 [Dehalococcoidales bacterium]|nr:hypothetical protein [Dehalococcoidales bacterium]